MMFVHWLMRYFKLTKKINMLIVQKTTLSTHKCKVINLQEDHTNHQKLQLQEIFTIHIFLLLCSLFLTKIKINVLLVVGVEDYNRSF